MIFRSRITSSTRRRRGPNVTLLDYNALEPRELLTTAAAAPPASSSAAPAATSTSATPTGSATATETETPLSAATAAPEIVANYSSDFNSGAFSPETHVGPLLDPNVKFVNLKTIDDPLIGLTGRGGHPGLSARNSLKLSADQFVVATYEAKTSGYYEIIDSLLRVADPRSNGVEFRVFINNGPVIFSGKTSDQGLFYFDARLGYVARGDKIRVAVGSNGDSSYDYFSIDFSVARFANREQIVGGYRQDFIASVTGQPTNWRYLWNAPHPNAANPLTSGPLEDRSSYRPLKTTKQLTAQPDPKHAQTAADLTLHQHGGHPGKGYPAATQAQAEAQAQNQAINRYAIATYSVDQSGNYAIGESFLDLSNRSIDGVEVIISTSRSDAVIRRTFTQGLDQDLTRQPNTPTHSDTHFDTRLGNLSRGDTIYVAFGAIEDHVRDSFQTDFSIVRILPREAPLRDFDVPATHVLRAADFGAIADDRIDDYAGIQSALTAAAKIDGPVKLVFQNGIYNLDEIPTSQNSNSGEHDEDTGAILINQIDDFIFEGQGAQFFISDPTVNFLNVWQSNRVILRNFEVDYVQRFSVGDTPGDDVYRAITFTQGIIESVDQRHRSIVLNVDPAITTEPHQDFFKKDGNPLGSGYVIDPKIDGRSKFNTPLRYLPTRSFPIDRPGQPHRHRIFFRSVDGLQPGDRFVFQRRGQQVVIGIFRGSNQVTVTGVVAYSSPATFISAGRSDNVSILHSHARIKPGRFKGINADAVHIQGNREGAWIEDSSFEGVGDDVANFYSLPSAISSIISPTELELTAVAFNSLIDSSPSRFQRGDKVLFYEPTAGRAIQESRVVSAKVVQGGPDVDHRLVSRVKFDQPILGAVVADPNDSPVLRYRNDIQVFNRELSKNGLIQNTRMANSRRYGLFLMAENIQIVDSTFSGLNSSAIAGHNQTGWPLGNIPRDILIQNNDFHSNGFSHQYLTNDNFRAVVSFRLDRFRDQVVDRPSNLISNLTIADNRFRRWGKTALSVRNAEHVNVFDNEFYASGQDLAGGEKRSAVEVQYSRDVRVGRSKLLATPQTDAGSFLELLRNRDSFFESPSPF